MSHEINNPLSSMPKHLQDMIPADTKQKLAENQTLQAAIYELADVKGLLEEDVKQLIELGKGRESDQMWRRSLYRAMFSLIEGVVYQMKQVAICTQGGFYQADFSREELALLHEESYSLRRGRSRTSFGNFAPIEQSLKFAYKKLAEGLNLSVSLEVSTQGWEQFKKAKEIRNNLIHPFNTRHES